MFNLASIFLRTAMDKKVVTLSAVISCLLKIDNVYYTFLLWNGDTWSTESMYMNYYIMKGVYLRILYILNSKYSLETRFRLRLWLFISLPIFFDMFFTYQIVRENLMCCTSVFIVAKDVVALKLLYDSYSSEPSMCACKYIQYIRTDMDNEVVTELSAVISYVLTINNVYYTFLLWNGDTYLAETMNLLHYKGYYLNILDFVNSTLSLETKFRYQLWLFISLSIVVDMFIIYQTVHENLMSWTNMFLATDILVTLKLLYDSYSSKNMPSKVTCKYCQTRNASCINDAIKSFMKNVRNRIYPAEDEVKSKIAIISNGNCAIDMVKESEAQEKLNYAITSNKNSDRELVLRV